MSITNDEAGLQRDDTTVALFKGVREFDQETGILTANTGVIVDAAGNYDGTALGGPSLIGNGPLGSDGVLLETPQFSRRFATTIGQYIDCGLIDQDFNDAVRASFTQQFVIKDEWDLDTTRYLFGGNNQNGAGAANDWLCRIARKSGGVVNVFWESNDGNNERDTPAGLLQEARWQVLTITWTLAATGFDIAYYVHTLETSGEITGGLMDFVSDFGTAPVSSSGVGNGRIIYGANDDNGPASYMGNVAWGRIYKGIIADVEGEATELLTTGTLAAPATNDLFRHEFNEVPDFIDEGPYGLHGVENFLVSYETDKTNIDLLGTGGRARKANSSFALISSVSEARTLEQDLTWPGARFGHFFNDSQQAVPAYTLQWWGTWEAGGSVTLVDWLATGESLDTNILIRYTLTDTDVTMFAERGSGTNIVRSNVVGSFDISDIRYCTSPFLLTIRADENPGSPGVMRARISINTDIDVLTYDFSGVPQGGLVSDGLRWRWANGGFFQEFKLSRIAISDARIVADAGNGLNREGPPFPVPLDAGPPALSSVEQGALDGGIPFLIRS